MRILFIVYISFLGLQTSNTIFEDGPQKHTVMALSGLHLRAEANKTAPIIKTLQFGSIVYSGASLVGKDDMDNSYKKDTVDRVIGHWIDAESREFDVKGFLFSPYVYVGELIDKHLEADEMRIFHEGIYHVDFDYHPDLFWYGLYKTEDTFNLKKVDLELLLPKVKRDSSYNPDGLDGSLNSVIVKTNEDERSIFLIGTRTPIFSEGVLPTVFVANDIGYSYTCESGFLYPNMKKRFYYNDKYYLAKAIEHVEIDSFTHNIFRYYDVLLEISNYDNVIYSRGIRDALELCCDAQTHSKFLTPQLYWMGDLNTDGFLDYIFSQHTMTDGSAVCWDVSLFMSYVTNGSVSIEYLDKATECH